MCNVDFFVYVFFIGGLCVCNVEIKCFVVNIRCFDFFILVFLCFGDVKCMWGVVFGVFMGVV